jgi:hypothetical protein
MEKPEIKVDEWLAGPQGMNFMLYPVKGVHTDEDVAEVKKQLYRDRDVVTLRTTWIRAVTMLLAGLMLFSSCMTVKKVVKTQEFQGSATLVVGYVIVKSIKFK